MPKLSRQTWIRIKYSLILLPAFIFSLFVSCFFQVRSQSQVELSKKIHHVIVPLVCIQVLCWIVVGFVLLIYLGILFPKKPHPGWSFGWAIAIVFIASLSIFVVRNFVASTNDYEARMRKFSLVNRYQRRVTMGQLDVLSELQPKEKCCGLNGYHDYDRASGKFDAINADNDQEDSRYEDCRLNITWDAFLRNRESGLSKKIKRLPRELALKDDEDVPRTCCRNQKDKTCNKQIFEGDKTKLDEIFTKGCSQHLVEHIHQCHDYGTLFLLFSLPWFIWVYTSVATWAHLRECQGLKLTQLGDVLCSEAVTEDVEAEPKPAETKKADSSNNVDQLAQASTTTISPFGPPPSIALTKSTTNTVPKPK